MTTPDTERGTFRMVQHHRVDDYKRIGWSFAGGLHMPHGHYSVLMVWLCACQVVEPLPEVPT